MFINKLKLKQIIFLILKLLPLALLGITTSAIADNAWHHVQYDVCENSSTGGCYGVEGPAIHLFDREQDDLGGGYYAEMPVVPNDSKDIQQQSGATVFITPFGSEYDLEKRVSCPKESVISDERPLVQSIEGGTGQWGNMSFKPIAARYRMVMQSDCYNNAAINGYQNYDGLINGEGVPLSFAVLSKNLIVPPADLVFDTESGSQATVSSAWINLDIWPHMDAYKYNNNPGTSVFTLFLKEPNFQGPVGFVIPGFWDGLKRDYPDNNAIMAFDGYFNMSGAKQKAQFDYEVQQRQAFARFDSSGKEIEAIMSPWSPVIGVESNPGVGSTILMGQQQVYSKNDVALVKESWVGESDSRSVSSSVALQHCTSRTVGFDQVTMPGYYTPKSQRFGGPIDNLSVFSEYKYSYIPGDNGCSTVIDWSDPYNKSAFQRYYQFDPSSETDPTEYWSCPKTIETANGGEFVIWSDDAGLPFCPFNCCQVTSSSCSSKLPYDAPSPLDWVPYYMNTATITVSKAPEGAKIYITDLLSNDSYISYYWSKFKDQPAIKNAIRKYYPGIAVDLDDLQAIVVSMHKQTQTDIDVASFSSVTRADTQPGFTSKPGTARISGGLLVSPPEGHECYSDPNGNGECDGWVPVVIKQCYKDKKSDCLQNT